MQLFSTKKRIAIGAGVAVVALGAGTAAYAYFTTGATGTGTATVGAPTALTIVQNGTTTGLLPGGTPQAIEYTIENTGSGAQFVKTPAITITGVTETADAIAAWGDPATPLVAGTDGLYHCTGAADFTLVQPNTTPGDIAAGATYDSTASAGHSGATIVVKNLAGQNQDACIGATVALHFAATS